MVRVKDKRSLNASHIIQDENSLGSHDKLAFTAEVDIPVRCPNCDNLMDSNYFFEGECPNCNLLFSKNFARDMFIEAVQIKTTHGGWNPVVLEALKGTKESCVLTKQFEKMGITHAHVKMVEVFVRGIREGTRRREAERNVLDKIRRKVT